MKIAGIDPGLSGGIAILDKELMGLEVCPMPTISNGRKDVLDPSKIARVLMDAGVDMVFIEKVGAMPGQGVTSMFSFGYGAGIIEGICAALQIPYSFVIPQTWMKVVLSGLPKGVGEKASIIWCQRMFPKVDWRKSDRSKKPHDGMTDATCIAFYGLKNV